MRNWIASIPALMLAVAGCGPVDHGEDSETSSAPPKDRQASVGAQQGGTISVGEERWTIVPKTQCSIYPGDVVSIAGHAAEDPSLEIVIDYGGPNQVVIGSGRNVRWHANKNSMTIKIDGRHVQGAATFTQNVTGTGESREGSFDVTC